MMSGRKRALILCVSVAALLTAPATGTEPVAGQQRVIGGVSYGPGVIVFPPGYVGAVWQVPYGGGYACFPGLTAFPYVAGGVSFRQTVRLRTGGVTVTSARSSLVAGTFFTGPPVTGCSGIFLPTDAESVVYGSPVPRLPQVSSGRSVSPVSVRSSNHGVPSFDGPFVLPEQLRGAVQEAGDVFWQAVRRAVRDRAVPGEFLPVTLRADVSSETFPEAAVQHTAVRAADAVMTGRLERARTLFQAVLTVRPDRPELWVQMAWIQTMQGDFDAAAISLKTALAARPRTAGAPETPAAVTVLPEEGERTTIDRSLRNWVLQQPGSVDRLQLAALWEQRCGRSRAARELLDLAQAAGLSADDRNRLASLSVRTAAVARGPAAEDSVLLPDEQIAHTP